jgi:hypothetical protein
MQDTGVPDAHSSMFGAERPEWEVGRGLGLRSSSWRGRCAGCCSKLVVGASDLWGDPVERAAAETRTGGSSISCSGSQRRESVTWDGAIRGYQHCALRNGNELSDVAKRVDKQDHLHYFRQPQADASL